MTSRQIRTDEPRADPAQRLDAVSLGHLDEIEKLWPGRFPRGHLRAQSARYLESMLKLARADVAKKAELESARAQVEADAPRARETALREQVNKHYASFARGCR